MMNSFVDYRYASFDDTSQRVKMERKKQQQPYRQYVNHDYNDHYDSECPESDDEDCVQIRNGRRQRKGPRGGVAVPFPEKLFEMLHQTGQDGTSPIVSWQVHGRAFLVHKPKVFVEDILPKFFKQTKMTSFQRQLNLYGFVRLTSGMDRGAYYHELFLRGRPKLCKRMVRTRVKGTGSKAAASPSTEPNFYKMRHCHVDGQESHQELPQNSVPTTTTDDNVSSVAPVVAARTPPAEEHQHSISSTTFEKATFTQSTPSIPTASEHSPDYQELHTTAIAQVSPVPSKDTLDAHDEFEALLPPPPLAAAPFSFAVNPWGDLCFSPAEQEHHHESPALISPVLGAVPSPLPLHAAPTFPSFALSLDQQATEEYKDPPSVVSAEDDLMEFVGDILFDDDDQEEQLHLPTHADLDSFVLDQW